MPDKKLIEKQHYDKKALEGFQQASTDSGLTNLVDRALIEAHRYFENVVQETMARAQKGRFLDFGCGSGAKTISFAGDQWQLTGIDISPESVKIARNMAQQKGVEADYRIMDCENMQFSDDSFDLILDYGTFSSLDMKKAVPEIVRILKKDGTLIAIETLGHNPLFNLKRKINVLTKRRTAWAAGHIMKLSDWEHLKSLFVHSDIKFFALLTPYTVPFLKLIPAKYRDSISRRWATWDHHFLKYKYLQKWAFKTVAVLSHPLK